VLRPDRPDRHHPRWLVAGVVATLGGVLAAAPAAAAVTTPAPSVNLKVLVIDRADPTPSATVYDTTTEGVIAELGREGVPYDVVSVAQANAFTTASLEDVPNHRARYQGVIMADPFEISSAAYTVIKDVETRYGLRQVNTDAYPGVGNTVGLTPVAAATTLDGNTISVTPAGKADAFGYLAGSLVADDNAPALAESQVYFTQPATPAQAGTTFTSLLDVKVGTATGTFASVYTEGGREQLTLTAAGSDDQQWLRLLSPGIVSWVTRGVNLGFHRNYFTVQVDDVFLPDARWSATGKCTPGDGCVGNVTTRDIRMTPADVTFLNGFTTSTGFPLDLAFNGSGSDLIVAANGSDPLMTAFTDPATASRYRWINHTYTHTFLGCIRVVPTVVGQTWRCATPADATAAGVVFEDPALVADATSDGTYLYLSQAGIENDIKTNIDWGKAHLSSTFDPTVLVTGEHSGLATLPQQPSDNPNLAAALASQGIAVTASDASRETGPRVLGSTSTLPRHPMNIFYNVGKYQDEVSEYNYIYNSTTDGGSGICSANPATSTCIPPLDASSNTAAKQSFDGYILPIEIRNAMRYVTSGDSRPFYAHQSNLTEDRILYPVLQGVLNGYAALYNTAVSPLVTSKDADMKELEHALHRADASSTATAYVDGTGVHLTGPAGTQIPLTVPASTTGTTGLSPYDGGLSGWVNATGSDTVVGTFNPAGAGYKVAAPAAPTNVTAVPGITSATVTWTPSQSGLADVTSWTITPTTGTTAGTPVTVTPAQVTPGATAGTLSYVLSGLKAGASYTFDVFGTNAIGAGAHAASAAVTILGLPAAPASVTATAGDATVALTWTAVPDVTGHAVTGYQVTKIDGPTSTPLPAASATATTLTVDGLTNGTAYTFTVAAVNDLGTGAAGTSTAVTPAVTPVAPPPPPAAGGGGAPAPPPAVAPGAPTLGTVTAGNGEVDVTWTAPASDGGSPVSGYVVTVYDGTGSTMVTTVPTKDTSAAITGLVNGTGYTVEVAAVNAVGTGSASARSTVVTPSTVPAKVSGVTVKRGAASLAVRWTAPADGGSAITGYVVTAYVGKGSKAAATATVAAAVLSTTVKGLKNGTGYTVDVRAVNATGAGASSARSAVVTPATTPGRPTVTGTKAGKAGGRSTALLAWRAPLTDGGAVVTAYRITATKYSASGRVLGRTVVTVRSGKARSAELRLAAGTYRFTVQAVNALGVGAASGPSKPTAAR
jgi:Fibronectin type III domain